MIRVNLAGTLPRRAAKAAVKPSLQQRLPVLLILMLAGTGAFTYYSYSSLSARAADLTQQIEQAEKQRKDLEAVIKQDQMYEARKKALENRIRVIDGLKRNQVSPVVSLDFLADAVARTQFVWLSTLDQNNTTFSMNGIGTSVDAIADFYSNLEATGYFRNINLQRAEDSRGNFTFSLTCEFAPPAAAGSADSAAPAERGAN